MSAIIVGAAETSSAEMNDKLDKVVIELAGQNLILVGVGPKYLVTVTAGKNGDVENIVSHTREAISKAETPL